MRILYLDPFAGASGDMFLGALLSLGVPLELLTEAVEGVIPGEVRLTEEKVTRAGLSARRCRVKVVGGPGERGLPQMAERIRASRLSPAAKEIALGALDRMGRAEAAAHGLPGGTHIHELGGQDTLADLAGTAAGIVHLAPGRILCGPVNVGRGAIATAHGLMPVPAPATALLLAGMPVLSRGPEAELTTPTGAALLAVLASGFGPLPGMRLLAVGCGAGSADHGGFPNLLRLFWGEESAIAASSADPCFPGEEETATMIECGLDDASPEYLAPLSDVLHRLGAREVHLIPAQTKKGRLGILLRVLVPAGEEERLMDAVLEHSGSPGLRFWRLGRRVLPRETVTVSTPHGPVRVKRWRTPSGREAAKPEYEDVAEASRRSGLPAREIRDLAMDLYRKETGGGPKKD